MCSQGFGRSGVDREVMRDGVWLRTGDLGLRRPDGSVEIRGRLKTVIMSGGFLIRPEEVDEVLSGHPAVAEAATVGVPDPDFGEVAISAVVLDGTADELDLTQHCRANLEPMKVPKRIVTVTEIPRGDAGKPKLEALRALLAPAEPATAPPNQTGLNGAANREPDLSCSCGYALARGYP